MNNTFINMSMQRIEDLTDQMVIHQQNGDTDMVMLLDKEARELCEQLDSGEIMTLPAM